MSTLLGWFFPLAALGAVAILAALVAHEVPRILGTLALVLTLAALAAAIPH
ncbi:hypothetical protein AB0M10_32910 [Streptomyces sp. NPDC051840]|uniref:hypothetical protein n=1 Tax=Streptomyces sp. NPDC051840 TaxID=3154752 RepID=UPI003425BC5B